MRKITLLSGGGANLTGGDLIDSQRRPPDNRAVQFLNGPGRNSAGVPLSKRDGSGDCFGSPLRMGKRQSNLRVDRHCRHHPDRAPRQSQNTPIALITSRSVVMPDGRFNSSPFTNRLDEPPPSRFSASSAPISSISEAS